MSNTINNHMNHTPFSEVQTRSVIRNNQNLQLKVAEFEKEQIESSVEVDISQEGRLKLENSSSNTKKAGVTSQREPWENNSATAKRDAGRTAGSKFNANESMRIDEPETYAKSQELWSRAFALFPSDDATEDEIAAFKKAASEAAHVDFDWYDRRCMATGWFQDPAKGKYATLDALEAMYSSEEHETSFNVYATEEKNNDGLWKFHSKFNVLISANMLKCLGKLKDLNQLPNKDKDQVSDVVGKITIAVNKMKDVEKAYQGKLEELQFGVKLWDNGDVTYHANYKDCENRDGIMANSAEELLEMLMKKE